MFKKGDLLKCVNPGPNDLTMGRTYEAMSDVYASTPSGSGLIKVMADNGAVHGMYAERFELKNPPTEATKPTALPYTTLPTDSAERKTFPLFSGLLRYFPAALAGVARTSKLGNDKHNPGQPLHHARGKSMDHGDCVIRHLMDVEDLLAALNRGDTSITDQQVLDEVNQMAWRALALAQEIHEQFGAPMAPGAKK
jgi:hypothetical protein